MTKITTHICSLMRKIQRKEDENLKSQGFNEKQENVGKTNKTRGDNITFQI